MESEARNKLERVAAQLADYENKKGLLLLKPKNDADIYINMPQSQMKTMTEEECGEACVVLQQYAAYLQQVYNIENGKVNWIEAEIKKAIAGELSQYNAPSAEERKSLAVKNNAYTAKLEEFRNWAKAMVDKLSFMSNRVEAIGKAYQVLLQSKIKRQR